MNIHDIKQRVLEHHPDNHFFDDNTMEFFGQTLTMFEVDKISDCIYQISAPMYAPDSQGIRFNTGKWTIRYFNIHTNDLTLSRPECYRCLATMHDYDNTTSYPCAGNPKGASK